MKKFIFLLALATFDSAFAGITFRECVAHDRRVLREMKREIQRGSAAVFERTYSYYPTSGNWAVWNRDLETETRAEAARASIREFEARFNSCEQTEQDISSRYPRISLRVEPLNVVCQMREDFYGMMRTRQCRSTPVPYAQASAEERRNGIARAIETLDAELARLRRFENHTF